MDIAERIVFELVGPSTEASWHERLPNRPDWQRYIGMVRTMIDDELFDANVRADGEQARAEAAEARVAGMCDLYNRQSDMLDAAKDRAEAAEAEVEAAHRYLDECFVNDPDEGRAVPLIDRVAGIVAENERLREQVATARELLADADDDGTMWYEDVTEWLRENSGQDAR